MNKQSRWLRVLLAVLLVASIAVVTYRVSDPMYSSNQGEAAIDESIITDGSGVVSKTHDARAYEEDNTLIFWYTDDSLTDYIKSVALSYQSETGVRIKPELVSGVELLEQINHASIYEGEMEDGEVLLPPDLYITTHDNLMKAYYAGIGSEITDPEGMINSINYPEVSLHAVTCDGKHVGYPLYYETNFFLYNKSYMADIAKQKIEDESSTQEVSEDTEDNEANTNESDEAAGEMDEEAMFSDEGGEPMGEWEEGVDQEVLDRLSTVIPSTIDDILTFANNYDAPEAVEAVFKWDVSDIFYNYFFVGNYMDVGGEDGDDNTFFNLYNQQAVDCLKVYGGLNQFFSIDSKAVNYDDILQEFIDGKTVFTVATTDALSKIREAKLNGSFNYEYGIAVLPDISSTLKARGLSETSSIVINGYSAKKDIANDFAQYISYTKASDLYNKTGKVTCLRTVKFEDEEISNIMQEYEKSVPLPKMIEASNYWVQLEIAFTKIWNGADPDATLKELNDTIGAQIDEIEYHVPIQESIKAGAD